MEAASVNQRVLRKRTGPFPTAKICSPMSLQFGTFLPGLDGLIKPQKCIQSLVPKLSENTSNIIPQPPKLVPQRKKKSRHLIEFSFNRKVKTVNPSHQMTRVVLGSCFFLHMQTALFSCVSETQPFPKPITKALGEPLRMSSERKTILYVYRHFQQKTFLMFFSQWGELTLLSSRK